MFFTRYNMFFYSHSLAWGHIKELPLKCFQRGHEKRQAFFGNRKALKILFLLILDKVAFL
jgi:hypothetical protein